VTAPVATTLPVPRSAHDRATVSGSVCLVPISFDMNAWGSWRPFAVESVQASMTAPGLARLASSPFLANGVSRGDLVAISSNGAGWMVDRLAEASDVSVLRVFAGSREELAPVVSALWEIGLTVRRHSRLGVAVVDVPAGRPLQAAIEATRRAGHALTAVEVSCHRQ